MIGVTSRRSICEPDPFPWKIIKVKEHKVRSIHCFDKEAKRELENLVDIIKQGMFQDYKLAYSEEGDAHKKKRSELLLLDGSYWTYFLCVPFSDSSQFSAASRRTR